ncbi:MAG: hypothetical protein ACOC33_01945 [bacterium]
MCGIIGSFNIHKFNELIKLNEYRGSFAYSFCSIDPDLHTFNIIKDFGKFNNDLLKNTSNLYHVGHIQAPTGGLIKDVKRIHPSNIHNTYLFHNGILKKSTIDKLQKEFNTDNNWDTHLLHMALNKYKFNILNHIDGSFGCLYINNFNIYLFSNDLINIFMDDSLSISSVKFKNSFKIKNNSVYKIDLTTNTYEIIDTFNTINNPYYILEE